MIVLHAIVPREAGAADPDLRRHDAGDVTVLYEERENPPSSDRTAVLAHGRRVVALAERVPVLPVRYGTTLPDLEELRAAVEEHGEAWSRRLSLLSGRCELVVHIDVADRPVDGPGDAESGRAYLLRRAEQVRRQERAFDAVRAVLGAWSAATRMLPDGRRIAVLVARVDADVAAEAVTRWASAQEGIEAVLTGPWPPFSFCEEADLT